MEMPGAFTSTELVEPTVVPFRECTVNGIHGVLLVWGSDKRPRSESLTVLPGRSTLPTRQAP